MSDNSEMDELVKEFLVESQENLDRLDRDLLVLEKNPSASDALAGIFRTIHTIKGTCGFLSFGKLEAVTHTGESLLSRLRDRELVLTPDIMTALLGMVDAVRDMLAIIEQTGAEGEETYPALIATLRELQENDAGNGVPPEPEPALVSLAPPAPVAMPARAAIPTPPAPAPVLAAPPPVAPANTEHTAPAAEGAARGASVADAYVRVDVGLLDKLMNLVGELVLTRNQILQFVATTDDQNFTATAQRLNLITADLQSGVMKTRMQPIGNIWEKLPRQVRDLSMSLGKQIRIEMEGRDTELDKTIIEAIKDPLTHIVRNCVDHGIETPDRRLAAGKSPEGRLTLRAFHEGGQVNIEISDDGAGLNVEKIRAKAVERGLISADQASRLTERDVFDLVFLPGFSTADKISNISGRGVGMDVVRTNVERIGGFVDLQSRQGHGTTFRIKIPLTLAIIPALIISCGGDRYAIPQISLLELVRLEGANARKNIERAYGAPVCHLRGSLLPLVHLGEELELPGAGATDFTKAETINIVVLQADGCRFGLVIDAINDTEEIVVKPLGRQLKAVSSFAGATIMGDGQVALILDVLGLAQKARVVGQSADRGRSRRPVRLEDQAQKKRSLLLFNHPDGRSMAVPLSTVARLEVLDASTVERLASQTVVQYRGDVMPLVDVASIAAGIAAPILPGREKLHVVVYGEGSRHVGVVVGQIVDIVEEAIDIKQGQGRTPGTLGCAVIQNRVTELLDLDGILHASMSQALGYGPGNDAQVES